MRTRRVPGLGLLLASLVLGACTTDGGRGGGPEQTHPPVTDPNALALVSGQGAFAVDLYAKLRSKDGNLLCSPYAIHEACSILRPGARGESAAQLDQTLHLPAQGVPEGWRVLHDHVRGDGQATLKVGNRLWIDRLFTLVPAYAASIKDVHEASIVQRSLADNAFVAREVNGWVKEATDGFISQAITPENVPVDAGLLIVNAIYFHGKWVHRFERSATRPLQFTTADGALIDVPTMTLSESLRYQADETVRTLALPYRGGTTELVLLLPTATDGLARLEQSLEAGALARWTTGGSTRDVDLYLPRFRFQHAFDLLPVLSDLGLADLKDPARVDLNGVGTDPRGPLRLTGATHTAVIELDEEGTKAAAATMVAGSCYAPVPAEPIVFRCDRPFLFVLRHVPTGAPLFIGRVSSPSGS